MDFFDVQLLIGRCMEAGVIDPEAITQPSLSIADFIDTAVEVVVQEDIEALLSLTTYLTDLPTPDDAILITVGISEKLMQIDCHLARWFLDTLLRDASPDMRDEMAMALEYELYFQDYCMQR